jgi:transposase
MNKFIRIGVDLGKNYFQVHALGSEDGEPRTRKLSRQAMRKFFSGIEPCLIGMEACASSHYWARELKAMGHDVRLIAPIYVKPYVKRGKNDAADAAAICEAMSRPAMRFVPVKSAENQAVLTLHKTRELLIKQRTMSVNALRGHLSEFGLIVAKGIGRVDALLALAEVDATLPSAARRAAKVLAEQIGGLDKSLHDLEAEIAAAHAASETSRLLVEVPGIGNSPQSLTAIASLIATAIVAHMPDPGVFERGRDFSAWLGLVPRQNSSGGKQSLGAITKKGNRYIRKLLVLAATSLLHGVGKRKGALRDWIVALLARKPARLVTVALANKLARIVFAMMKTGEAFRAGTFAKA